MVKIIELQGGQLSPLIVRSIELAMYLRIPATVVTFDALTAYLSSKEAYVRCTDSALQTAASLEDWKQIESCLGCRIFQGFGYGRTARVMPPPTGQSRSAVPNVTGRDNPVIEITGYREVKVVERRRVYGTITLNDDDLDKILDGGDYLDPSYPTTDDALKAAICEWARNYLSEVDDYMDYLSDDDTVDSWEDSGFGVIDAGPTDLSFTDSDSNSSMVNAVIHLRNRITAARAEDAAHNAEESV
jgi:hypothetical protein